MNRVKRLTCGSKLGRNRFISTNAAMECGEEVKNIIIQAMADAIHTKDQEHAIAIKEVKGETK